MLNTKLSVGRIATEIGRYRSTVYREIKWNRFVDDELPKLNRIKVLNAKVPVIKIAVESGSRGHPGDCHSPDRRKKRRPSRRITPRGLVFAPDSSIHERPDYVKTRETFGKCGGGPMVSKTPLALLQAIEQRPYADVIAFDQ